MEGLSDCMIMFEKTWKFKEDGSLRCSEEPTGHAMRFFEKCGSFIPKELNEERKNFAGF